MIALYRGTSFMSRLIKFFNWSEYSHASWVDKDNMEFEAWQSGGGVQYVPFGKNHKKDTVVDLYNVKLTANQIIDLETFLRRQIGKKYDWGGCFGFLTRRKENNQAKWFCSELVAAAFEHIKHPLLENIPPYKIYPGMLSYSPKLKFYKTTKIK